MAEENETPGGDPGSGPEGPHDLRSAGRIEGDLLSERRARRAAESGEIALTRRAEAAEATVQTLEVHVATLQQRLREAEEERGRIAELLDAERTVALEREHELRRVKQREYAEQQLRVEAEERLISLDRENRVEIEELARRLGASERDARDLGARLEDLQRQLAEAEQSTAAESAAIRRAEGALHARLSELEARAAEIQLGLEAERAARERSENMLENMREGHRRMEILVGDLKGILARLSSGLSAAWRPAAPEPPRAPEPPGHAVSPPPAASPEGAAQAPPPPPPSSPEPAQLRGAEMADALAAAVERLRARADAAATAARPAQEEPRQPAPERVPHKHSMSLIGRLRNRRKQRRSR
jgi:hypothetical protein